MQTDLRPSTGIMRAFAVLALLVTAAPRGAAGQGPSMGPDTATEPRAKAGTDCWYAEGAFRFRGRRYSVFAGASVTQFTSAAARAAYGTSRLSPIIDIYRPRRRGLSPAFEVNDVRIGSDNATARVLGLSAGLLHRPLDAEPSRRFVPYYAVTVGPRFARTASSERTTVAGVGTLIGLELMRSVRLTVRHEALPAVFGRRLSTVSFGAAFRLPPYRARPNSASQPAQAACAATPHGH